MNRRGALYENWANGNPEEDDPEDGPLAIARNWSESSHPGHPAPSVKVALLREIIGNPFRPVSMGSAWLTTAVKGIDTGAYDEGDLPSEELDAARLAVLAD